MSGVDLKYRRVRPRCFVDKYIDISYILIRPSAHSKDGMLLNYLSH